MTKENACSRTDEQLALAAQGGSSDALAQLIPRFLPMIRQKAGRYSFVGLEQDDFVQEGLIGLLSAVQNYDPGRNASFRTFAAHPVPDVHLSEPIVLSKTSAAQ